MTKLCYFIQDNSPDLSVLGAFSSPIVCWWPRKEPVCWWRDEDADLETDRVTTDARNDHHWQSRRQ